MLTATIAAQENIAVLLGALLAAVIILALMLLVDRVAAARIGIAEGRRRERAAWNARLRRARQKKEAATREAARDITDDLDDLIRLASARYGCKEDQ